MEEMKKYLLMSLALTVCSAGNGIMANPIDGNAALEIAKDFYMSKLNTAGRAADAAGLNFEIVYDSNDDNSSSVLKTKSKNTDPTYYVINAGGDNGYVIVAGDDEAETILGYTLDGRVDTDNIPANMLSWLEFYDSEIADLRSQTPARGMVVGELTDPADQYTNVIYPLLRDTKWNQDAPYNAQCPTYNGRSTYVGCVATAIGQIIYYNRYPTQPEGSVNYTTDAPYNINVRANFDNVTFDYDKMLPNYDTTPGTAEQQAEVAKLLFNVGAAARMNYGTDASGTNDYNLYRGLTQNFGYSESLRIINRCNTSLADWHAAIQGELALNRPVYHTGSGDGGHAFVCDGYDGAGMYHFNWGWGGISDGYFRLTSLNPRTQGIGGNTRGYDHIQSILVNLVPAGENDEKAPTELCIVYSDYSVQDKSEGLMIDKTSTGRTENATLTFGAMTSGGYSFTGFVGALLLNENGETVTELTRTMIGSLEPGYMRGGITLSFDIPTSVADGTYRLRLGYMETSRISEGWHLMNSFYAAPAEFIVNVTSSGITYNSLGAANLTASDLEVPEHVYQNRNSQFKVKFQNQGDAYYSYLGVVIMDSDNTSNQQLNGLNVVGFMRNGDEIEVTVNATITLQPGQYTVYPVYDANVNIENPSLRALGDVSATINVEASNSNPNLELMPFDDGSTTLNIQSGNGFTSKFNVRVRNNGEYFSGNLRFRLNNVMNMTNYAYGYAEIGAGETVDVEMSGELMLEPGTYTGSIGYQVNNAYLPITGTYTVIVSAFSGLDTTTGDSGVKVYPSPAADFVTIEAASPIEAVELYNADGTLQMTAAGSGSTVTLNVSDLNGGLYIARVRTADSTTTHRIIKK